jgi:hypothetical protein
MHLKTWALVLAVVSAPAASVSIASARVTQDRRLSAASKANERTAKANDRTIRGVWRTVVTPHNCQTGQTFPSLQGVFTFHRGGTMAEYGIGPGSSPALRSPGHGVWQREHGWQDYSFAFTFYRYDASGVLLGSQKVTAALELGGSGDEFVSRSRIETLDVNDKVVGTGCATAVGTRFE